MKITEKIMRMALAIALMFVAGSFIVATATKGSKYPHFFKHRTKLREIRGFKPEYISTAIGFGKRDGPAETLSDVSGRDRDLSSILRNLSRIASERIFTQFGMILTKLRLI
ncbi:PREDICTED: allatotropin-like [Trachymyrmex cornetzi]|uniref:allatotropin-like n=1 Tax=Trachymyrmex cornetzi TaxID=471704 RepID=UPI00084F2DD5|nr:PREDICTED: allatotropin-like [Trachymyrmex cornetzi]